MMLNCVTQDAKSIPVCPLGSSGMHASENATQQFFLIQDSFTELFLLLTLTIAHFLNFSLPKAHLILAF